jgi:hypothetical protein
VANGGLPRPADARHLAPGRRRPESIELTVVLTTAFSLRSHLRDAISLLIDYRSMSRRVLLRRMADPASPERALTDESHHLQRWVSPGTLPSF